jgi:hypothetical protein
MPIGNYMRASNPGVGCRAERDHAITVSDSAAELLDNVLAVLWGALSN